jgi:squalene synthase HpnC
VLGQARSENFPVASMFLPPRLRAHLMAIYGFARLADDIGDEAEGDRLAQLDWLSAELERAKAGTATHPLLQKLSPTLRQLDLPTEPFHHLIEANRIDQRVTRYQTFDDLLAYCRLSAVPVGRLVLLVFGSSTPERVRLSDDVCIGLQLVEHLQDVAEDAARGRIYLPAAELDACGVSPADLVAAHAGPGLQRLVAVHVARSRRLLASGGQLTRLLPWSQGAAVAGFAGGGLAALDAIQGAGYDVLGTRCRPRTHRLGAHMLALRFGPGVAA